MKLHELQQKRNTIATDMRALHEKIGEATWTDEQRNQWNAAKSELDALDEQIGRQEELRRLDQYHIEDLEDEQRREQRNNTPEAQNAERRAAAFNKFLRHGFSELSAEERQAIKELRAQGTSPDAKGGYTVPTQILNKIVDSMKPTAVSPVWHRSSTLLTGRTLPGPLPTARRKRVNSWAKTRKPPKKM